MAGAGGPACLGVFGGVPELVLGDAPDAVGPSFCWPALGGNLGGDDVAGWPLDDSAAFAALLDATPAPAAAAAVTAPAALTDLAGDALDWLGLL